MAQQAHHQKVRHDDTIRGDDVIGEGYIRDQLIKDGYKEQPESLVF